LEVKQPWQTGMGGRGYTCRACRVFSPRRMTAALAGRVRDSRAFEVLEKRIKK